MALLMALFGLLYSQWSAVVMLMSRFAMWNSSVSVIVSRNRSSEVVLSSQIFNDDDDDEIL